MPLTPKQKATIRNKYEDMISDYYHIITIGDIGIAIKLIGKMKKQMPVEDFNRIVKSEIERP